MAITRIHKITSTVDKAIDYCMKDKTEEHVKDDIADVINYATNDKLGETTYYTFNSSYNCFGDEKEFFKEVIERGRGKNYNGQSKTKDGSEVLAWHLVQSFDTVIDPRVANEIGLKLAKEMFPEFPVTISTHTNTDNTHNHLIICAWDLKGKKWNNCNENYRKIRETSDRLCDEYGLNVLEETRKQKLIRFKDEDGNIRYFEPTSRKIDLIKQREEGMISTDDVNSYRNTMDYEDAVMKELSNKEIIKYDIDNLLNAAESYDHLLQMLRDIGYEIRDKKKNGDWLAHISFKNPTANKATRDSSLSDDGFYERKNLTAYIDELAIKRREQENEKKKNTNNIYYFEDYNLETTNVNDIDEHYKKIKNDDGTFHVLNRTIPEMDIIRELKKTQKEAGIYDISTIKKLIVAQQEAKQKQRKYIPKSRKEELIIRIQDGFENLKFIEEKNIQSFEHANRIMTSLYDKQTQCQETIEKLDSLIEHLENIIKTPQKLEEIKKRINQKLDDPVYLEFEYETDKNLIQTYQNIIDKYKINDSAGIETLQIKINSAKIRIHKLKKLMEMNRDEIDRYDRCIRVLERAEKIREKELNQENGERQKTRDALEDKKEKQKENNGDERER